MHEYLIMRRERTEGELSEVQDVWVCNGQTVGPDGQLDGALTEFSKAGWDVHTMLEDRILLSRFVMEQVKPKPKGLGDTD